MPSDPVEFRVIPGGALRGRIRVPGDKSVSHRAVMLGSIAEGVTTVAGFLEAGDTLATLGAMRALGVHVEGPEAGGLRVHGVGLRGLRAPGHPLDLGNSGTGLRLLAGLLSGQPFDTVLTGDPSLSRRPMRRISEPLVRMGAGVETQAGGTPPLTIRGRRGPLTAIDYALPVPSAQVKSCVLLAGLYAEGRTCVHEAAPTRDHTERMLAGFGYPVERGPGSVCLAGGGRLRATRLAVPADISSAAFFLVGAAVAPGSDLTLEGVGVNPTRTGIITLLRLMGARIEISGEREEAGEPVAEIHVRASPLHGIDVPEELVPLAIDEFPALFVAAACAEGETVLRGAAELRVKESDRIAVMAEGLSRLGVEARPTADGIAIRGGPMRGGRVVSGGDHRVAMAFAMAGLRCAGPLVIEDCANVRTSFPGFPALARRAGAAVEVSGEAGASA